MYTFQLPMDEISSVRLIFNVLCEQLEHAKTLCCKLFAVEKLFCVRIDGILVERR